MRTQGAVLPHLFGGTRSQRLVVGPAQDPKKKRTVEDAERDRNALAKAQSAVDSALAGVHNISAAKPIQGSSQEEVNTNYFPVNFSPKAVVYQYDVVIEPDLFNPRNRSKMLSDLLGAYTQKANAPDVIIRRKIAYSAVPLKAETDKTPLELSYNPPAGATGWRSFARKVKLTFTRTISNVKEGISTEMYGVSTAIIAEAYERVGFTKIGGSFFDLANKLNTATKVNDSTYSDLTISNGVRLALHPTQRGLLLNCDLSSRVTRTCTVLQEIARIGKAFPGKEKEVVSEEIKGTLCATTYALDRKRQTFKVKAVRYDLNPTSVIPSRPGQAPGKLTFKEYIETRLHEKVTDLKQPMLEVELTKELDKDGKPLIVYYAPELANIVGQSDAMRRNGPLQQTLKRQCLLPPTNRFNKIYTLMSNLVKMPVFTNFLKSWGMEITPKCVSISATILPPPTLKNRGGNGEMNQNPRNHSWLVSQPIIDDKKPAPKHWTVICPDFVDCAPFVSSLMKDTINKVSARWPEPDIVKYSAPRSGPARLTNLARTMEEQVYEKTEFVLMVLPSTDEDVYIKFKTETLQNWAIPSQGVLVKNVTNERNLLNVSSRVGGQMLVKWGSLLWNTPAGEQGTLVCGIDFASSSKGEQVVGLSAVSGTDLSPVKDVTKTYRGKAGEAIAAAIGEAVNAYNKKYANAPLKNIIVYRSGMDEGDVPRIVDEEVLYLQTACDKKKVNLCFLASLKRSHARFYPASCGCTVDKDILPATGYSFLMVPQVCNIGTATAMKFSVLANNIKELEQDGGRLQKLTFSLCHMFQGWWATTREPSVIMYATRLVDLVSKMAKPDQGTKVNNGGHPVL